jgi:hypothetical protein
MLGGLPVIYGIDPHNESVSQDHQLGTVGYTPDGRKFRYARAGGTVLVAGNVLQSPAQSTDLSLTPSSASIGATSVTVTTAAAVTANLFSEGYLVVTNTPGNGLMYRIKSHPATSAAASCVITLAEPLIVALTGSSRVDLVKNPYNGVIQNPAIPSSCPVGVAVKAITAEYYGWIQDSGICSVLAGGTLAVGNQIVTKLGTAASVLNAAAATTEAFPIIGYALTSGTNGENASVYLSIN